MEKDTINGVKILEVGWIWRWSQVKRDNKQPDETTWIDIETPIYEIKKDNGETWYKQENNEYNGKYVLQISYAKD